MLQNDLYIRGACLFWSRENSTQPLSPVTKTVAVLMLIVSRCNHAQSCQQDLSQAVGKKNPSKRHVIQCALSFKVVIRSLSFLDTTRPEKKLSMLANSLI